MSRPITKLLALWLICSGCDGATVVPPPPEDGSRPTTDGGPITITVTIDPNHVALDAGGHTTFTATVSGTADHRVTWRASGGTIDQSGNYTAPDIGGAFVVQVASAVDARAVAVASVDVTSSSTVLEPFFDDDHHVMVVTPTPRTTYFAPATVRVWAHANYNYGYSPLVEFYLGDALFASVPSGDLYDYYEATTTITEPGTYLLSAHSIAPDGTVESVPVPIEVIAPPAYTTTVTLTEDRVLTGNEDLEIAGDPDHHALLTSTNGSVLRSDAGWSGSLTLRNVDIVGLGAMNVASIDVTASGSSTIDIEGCTFDHTGPLALSANDSAALEFRGNTLRPNMQVTVNANPDYGDNQSWPVVLFTGNSSIEKHIAANTVGLSWLQLDSTSNWLIGGSTDADSNVLIGVRAGVHASRSSDIVLRGNFSYCEYPYGWTQGLNFQFLETHNVLVEHNVIRNSSWLVRGLDGEMRYNLLLDNNHAFVEGAASGASVHHNVMAHVGFRRAYYPNQVILLYDGTSGVSFYNNTVDAGGGMTHWADPIIQNGNGLASMRNNVFTGWSVFNDPADPLMAGSAGIADMDYNCFYNPDAPDRPHYDASHGANDCGGAAGADPMFGGERRLPFPFYEGDILTRAVTVSTILAYYRSMYTPRDGSPLVDHGNPSDDVGGVRATDIGAVDAGNRHPEDGFGLFGL